MKFCNVCFSLVFGCSVYKKNKVVHLNSLLGSWPVTANAGCAVRPQQHLSVCLRETNKSGGKKKKVPNVHNKNHSYFARSHQGKGNPTRAPLVFQRKSDLIVSVNS